MDPLRLILHHFDPAVPSIGGVDTCIRGLVRFGRGYRFASVGMSEPGHTPKLGAWSGASLAGRTVQAMYVGRVGRGGPVPNIVRLGAGALRWARVVRQIGPDVVQVHRAESVWVARQLFPRARLDLFLHEDARTWSRSTTSSRWRFANGLHVRTVARAAQLSDRVVCFSPSAGTWLESRHENVLTLPTWFDPDLFLQAPRSEIVDDILWVGRLERVKDPLLALDVLAALPDQYRMTMVGEGSLDGAIRDRAQKLGVSGRLTLTGLVNKASVAALIRRHAALLMTSHSEGFPRVLVETLASGRPVVGTSGSDTGRVLFRGENGARATSRDPGELALLLQEAIDVDPARCRASVRDQSAPAVVNKILEEA